MTPIPPTFYDSLVKEITQENLEKSITPLIQMSLDRAPTKFSDRLIQSLNLKYSVLGEEERFLEIARYVIDLCQKVFSLGDQKLRDTFLFHPENEDLLLFFQQACDHKHLDIVDILLQCEIDQNRAYEILSENFKLEDLLESSSRQELEYILNLLAERDLDLFKNAAENGYTKAVQIFYTKAKPTPQTMKEALSSAAQNGHKTTVEALLNMHLFPQKDLTSAYDIAVFSRQDAIAELIGKPPKRCTIS